MSAVSLDETSVRDGPRLSGGIICSGSESEPWKAPQLLTKMRDLMRAWATPSLMSALTSGMKHTEPHRRHDWHWVEKEQTTDLSGRETLSCELLDAMVL